MALQVDFLLSYDEESLKAELRRLSKLTGKQTVSKRDIEKYGRVGSGTFMRRFGSLHNAHKAAGLIPGVLKTATNQDLLKMLVDLWKLTDKKFGRSPLMKEVVAYGLPVTAATIAARFGSWRRALLEASKMVTSPPNPAKPECKRRPKRKRGWISPRKRFLVFRRDKYICQICKRGGGELQVDHVIPLCRGGSEKMENLQTLCRECNMGKSGDLE